MNKLKPIANEILNIKKEMLNKNHSTVIKKALEISVDRMLAEGFIDLDMHLCIKDDNYSFSQLKKEIETSDKYLKTEEELLTEYEVLTEKLNHLVSKFDLEDYYINVNLESDKINICKVFSLDAESLKRYFCLPEGANSKEYLEKLMKRNGFVQQYAVLRLPRIISNFIEMYPINNKYKMSKSHSYFQADKKTYSIDLVFSMDSYLVEKIDENSDILLDIYNKINEAGEYFQDKISS